MVVGGLLCGSDGEWSVEVKADESFRGDPDLLSAGGALKDGSSASTGTGADSCSFAAAEDATKDGADGSASANLFGGVGAAAFAFDGVGLGGDGDGVAVAAHGGEFDGEPGAAFEVGSVLGVDDGAPDGGSDGEDDEAVGDDFAGYDAGEGRAGLGGLAIEGLVDANGDIGAGAKGDLMIDRRGRRWSAVGGGRKGALAGDLLALLGGGGARIRGLRGSGHGGGYGHAGYGEIVDHFLDTVDAGGIFGGDGAGGVVAHVAGERDDAGLDGDLDGLLADRVIAR